MDTAARARLDRWMQSLRKTADLLLEVAPDDLVIAGDPVELAQTLTDGNDVAATIGPHWDRLRRAAADAGAEGEQVLWLVLGTLTWSDRERATRTSPLVLWPVAIDGDRLVAAADRSPRVNHALVERLQSDYELDLCVGDERNIDVSSLLNLAEAALADREGWGLARGARLGIYSLSSLEIWRDLTTRSDEVSAPLAQLLGLEKAPVLPDPGADPNLCVPLDGDASQVAAIRAAACGGSLVLQGAPGTGKTHTVANMAAHCISQGRSTLIVSDRPASLREIERRLASVGLGEACVFAGKQLPRPSRRSRGWTGPTTTGAQLAQLSTSLDEVVAALHRSTCLGLSIYQVLARLTELRTTPNAALADPDAPALDRQTYSRRRQAVEELAVAARAVDPIATHPWRASKLGAWGWQGAQGADCDVGPRCSMMRGRAEQALETAAESTAALKSAIADVLQLVPGVLARTPEEIAALGALAELAAASPRPGAELFSTTRGRIDDVGEAIALVRVRGGGTIDVPRDPGSFMALAARHRALVAEIADQLTEEGAEGLDAVELWAQLKKWTSSVGPVRFVALRSARAQIRAASLPLEVWTDELMLTVLEAIIAERACRDALEQAAEPAQRWFGELVRDPRTIDPVGSAARPGGAGTIDPAPHSLIPLQGFPRVIGSAARPGGAGTIDLDQLEAAVAWAADLRKAFDRVAVVDGQAGRQAAWRALIAQVVAPMTNGGVFSRVADAVSRWSPAIAELGMATGIESDMLGAGSDHLDALRVQIDSLQQAVDSLPDWARFYRARQHALDEGAVAVVSAIERGDVSAVDLAPAWERASLLEWLASAIAQEPHLAQFDGGRHHAMVSRFVDLDRGELAISRGRLSPHAACVLATPQAVARYDLPTFDLVVFDDASRLPVAHALGAVARGRAAVFVGDGTLPRAPGISESALDAAVAAGLPELALSTHYRSQHHDLFWFANRRYYGGDVHVTPAAYDSPEQGVRWTLAHGASDARGANRAEAQAIVDDIAIKVSRGHRSFAVVVASAAQRHLVEERLAAASIHLSEETSSGSGVLVGTPDQLWGEQRDIVYLSIGCDAVAMRAGGPVDGEHWLAVGTTRATNELVVVSSFSPEEIADTDSQFARGLAELIEFARSGETRAAEHRLAADAITEAIGRALMERGWMVRYRVGHGVGEVGLAVLDPDDPRRCVLAIEHDDVAYAAAPCARDRDRLREQQLVQSGWRVHRVWSLDWWTHPEREIQRAHAAIVTAIAAGRQRGSAAVATVPIRRRAKGATAATAEAEPIAAQSAIAQGSGPTAKPQGSTMVPVRIPRGAIAIGPYTAAAIPCGRRLPDDMFAGRHCGELAKVVEQVLAAEAPIHVELLSRRAAAYFGVGRLTARITDHVRSVLEGRGRLGDEPDIIWRADQDPTAIPAVRVAGGNAVACRDIAQIPLAEVAAAARIVVERASGLAQPELIRDCARLLGFARLTDRVTDRVSRGVELAAGRELISIENGRVHLTV